MKNTNRTSLLRGCIFVAAVVSVTLLSGNAFSAQNDPVKQPTSLKPRAVAEKPAITSVASEVNISHVVVKFTDQSQFRLGQNGIVSKAGASLAAAEGILRPYVDIGLRRLFQNIEEDELDRKRAALENKTKHKLANLNSYYRLEITDAAEAERVINELNALDIVEIAYFQPMPEVAGDIDPPTPDYQPNQDYRLAAPAGVDADYANLQTGGDGTGVKIVDIEIGWHTTHEDLDKALGAIIGTVPPSGVNRNHGTAVIGEMIAGDNGYGVTGICPGADIGMVSVYAYSTAEALYLATENLQPGDMILIELHSPGPHYDFQTIEDSQLGYVCMEYWQANFDAIQYAWAKGIVVIEAAGNGSEDFDDELIYGSLFDTTYRNSHAIIAGAGWHYSSGQNLEAHSWSNAGERVNLQGYGSGVYTTGYGDLFSPDLDENQFYTASFSGTSSASPIVTGSAACLQGYYENAYGVSMTSDQIRDVLVTTGTPQAGSLTRPIGPRPDLAAAFAVLQPPASFYANPIMLEAEVAEGEIAHRSLWIVNRSTLDAYDFVIADNDSLILRVAEDWLRATPQSGTVAASDSVLIDVTVDGSVIEGRLPPYKGAIEISWGPTGALDSLLIVPTFFTVACNDFTYQVAAIDEPEGPTYDWIDAKTLGSKISTAGFYANGGGLDPLDDGTAGPYPIGFDLHFYDNTYSEFYVGVNGAISFTEEHVNSNGYFTSLSIPGTFFQTLVSPYWNDLILQPSTVPDAGVYLYTSESQDTTVIEWYHISNFNNTSDHSTNFEIILIRTGEIIFQYANIGQSDLELSAMIGIDEIDCKALGYYSSGEPVEHIVSTGDAIRFRRTEGIWIRAGDANNSGDLNISDVTYLVDYLYGVPLGPPPPIMSKANANCDIENLVNISDITYLVNYLFGIPTGPEPCYYWYNP